MEVIFYMYKPDDLIGKRFGNILVDSYYDNTKYGKRFLCKCDCGNEIIRQGTLIYNNRVHSCGCQIGKWNIGKKREEESKSHIGEKFNRLTIIGYEHNSRKNQRGYIMICKCDCGNITKQIYSDLKTGKVKSCGCWQKEQASKTGSTVGLNNCRNQYNWYFIKDGERINCRSGYEVIYANWLMENDIDFEYEPKCFHVAKNRNYTPDFYLINSDEYIEIKGTFKVNNSHQKDTIEIFKENYNHKVIFWNELRKICNIKYKTYITLLRQADKNNIQREDYLGQNKY